MPVKHNRLKLSPGTVAKQGAKATGQPAATKADGATQKFRGEGERRDFATDFPGSTPKWDEFDHGLAS